MQPRTMVFWCVLVFTLCTQIFVLFFGGWHFYAHMDNVLHFFYGMLIFLVFVMFFKWKPLDALLLVLVFQFFWEASEIIGDQFKLHIVEDVSYNNDFFWDGLKDTIVDGLGALFGWLFCRNMPENKPSKIRIWMMVFLVLTIPMIIIGIPLKLINQESPDLFVFFYLCATLFISIIAARTQFFRNLQPR